MKDRTQPFEVRDYLNHILEAIDRIEKYTGALS